LTGGKYDEHGELSTSGVLRFVKYKGAYSTVHRLKRPMADWWERLRNAKKVEIIDKWDIEYLHFYQNNLDKERQKRTTMKKAAKLSVYHEFAEGKTAPRELGDDGELTTLYVYHDFERTMSDLNDNDIVKYYQDKENGHKELKSKQRQNAINELKLAGRPPPKLKPPKDWRQFKCEVCGEEKSEFEMAINITERGDGICMVCRMHKQLSRYVQ
jgi:hypothetical protein